MIRDLLKSVCGLLLALAVVMPATARTYLVGLGGSPCTHSSLSAAITAAANNPGPDEIRLIQGMADGEQAITINGQDLTITGGYENCGDPDVTLERTLVSGLGGATAPVFQIIGPGVVHLENLQIVSGDSLISGGGIRYVGSAIAGSVNVLFLSRTVVDSNNTTLDGGGLYFRGNNDRPAELILEQDTGFFRNTAGQDGGAIHLMGNALLNAEAHRLFFWNNAAQMGSGGAIHVLAPANAVIGSATWLGDATFRGNVAGTDGGAIHVDASSTPQQSLVRLYSLLPDQPLVFDGNIAGSNGGAISVLGNLASNTRNVSVCVRNVNLLRNVAADGAALRATKGEYGYCPGIPFPAAALIACTPRQACGRINGNLSNGASTRSSVVRLFGALADFRDTRVHDNVVRNDVFLLGEYVAPGIRLGSQMSLINGVVSNNGMSDPSRSLFRLEPASYLALSHVTLAGNTPAATLFSASSNAGAPSTLIVRDSILYQPGSGVIDVPPDATLDYVLFHQIPAGHAGNATLRAGDPQFAANSLRPLPSSIAVDYAPNQGDAPFDLDGNLRFVDLSSARNSFGTVDLGAYEIQFGEAGELFSDGFEE